MKTRAQKKAYALELAGILKSLPNIYLTEYQGLKFQELADLKSRLRSHQAQCRVVKNSLLHHALKQAGIETSGKLLSGPIAFVAAPGSDPVMTIKILINFAKEFPHLKVKAGFVDAQWLDGAECKKLAALGSRHELLSQLASALHFAISQGARVLAAPICDLVLILKALAQKSSKSAGATV